MRMRDDSPLPRDDYDAMDNDHRMAFAISAGRIILMLDQVRQELERDCLSHKMSVNDYLFAAPAALLAVTSVWGRSPTSVKAQLDIDEDAFFVDAKELAACFLRNLTRMNARVAGRGDPRAIDPADAARKSEEAIRNLDAADSQPMIRRVVRNFIEQYATLDAQMQARGL